MPEANAIKIIRGRATPLRGKNIDTDRIIPARYLKVISFDTLGEFSFYDERFDKDGNQLPHPLNDERFQGAHILIVESNFGSGSSREHAPQALMRYGFRAFIGESFAEIFQGNCLAMGLPTVTLPRAEILHLLDVIEENPQREVVIDIAEKSIEADRRYALEIDAGARSALLHGSWDSTNSLLRNREDIHKTAARIPYLHNFKK